MTYSTKINNTNSNSNWSALQPPSKRRKHNPTLTEVAQPILQKSTAPLPKTLWIERIREFDKDIGTPLKKRESLADKIELIKKHFTPYPDQKYALYLTLDDPKGVCIKMVLENHPKVPRLHIYESIKSIEDFEDCEILVYDLHLVGSHLQQVSQKNGCFLNSSNLSNIDHMIRDMLDEKSTAKQEKITFIAQEILSNSSGAPTPNILSPSPSMYSLKIPEIIPNTLNHQQEIESVSSSQNSEELSDPEELIDTKCVSKEEFDRDFVAKIKSKSTLQSKFPLIKEFFSTYSNKHYGLYVEFDKPQVCLKLNIQCKGNGYKFTLFENIEQEDKSTKDSSLVSFFVSSDDSISDVKFHYSKSLSTEETGRLLKIFAEMFTSQTLSACYDTALHQRAISREEFDSFWESLKTHKSLALQTDAIAKSFTKVKNNKFSCYVKWDESKDIDLKFTLKKGKFKSEAIGEEFFNEKMEKRSFYFLKVYEKVSNKELVFEQVILKMLISENQLSELSWIQKGEKLSGNDVLNKIYSLIPNSLLIKKVVLYDDAVKDKNTELRMRKIDGLTNPEDGKSWYEKNGLFTASRCSEVKTIFGNTITQTPEEYLKAKKIIRNTTLDQLYEYLNGHPQAKRKLTLLRKRYLKSPSKEDTLHSLAKAINAVIRAKETPQNEKEATEKDLAELLYNTIDPSWKPEEGDSQQKKEYLWAIDYFESVCLFEREYRKD